MNTQYNLIFTRVYITRNRTCFMYNIMYVYTPCRVSRYCDNYAQSREVPLNVTSDIITRCLHCNPLGRYGMSTADFT